MQFSLNQRELRLRILTLMVDPKNPSRRIIGIHEDQKIIVNVRGPGKQC